MNRRISEKDLIIPALYCISNSDMTALTTSDLSTCLRELLRPRGEDLEILSGRSDDKFSQKVRNLKSHDTLQRLGLCKYDAGMWRLEEYGEEVLEANKEFLEYLLENGFNYEDVRNALTYAVPEQESEIVPQTQYFDENLVVTEGVQKHATQQTYVRSSTLRTEAIKHFTHNGRIKCEACGFDFEEFYGSHGEGFIEIHHIKPIVSYSDEDISKTISDAIANVVPLCANCHRMVHRSRDRMLSIEELRELIEAQSDSSPPHSLPSHPQFTNTIHLLKNF